MPTTEVLVLGARPTGEFALRAVTRMCATCARSVRRVFSKTRQGRGGVLMELGRRWPAGARGRVPLPTR